MAAAERLKFVQIENLDFRRIFEIYDGPDTLFYVDPPYVGYEREYHGNFSEQDHHDLAIILNSIKGKAMLSYYEHPLINELYKKWNRKEISTLQWCVNRVEGEKRNAVTELILMNYQLQVEQMSFEMFV